MKITRPLTDKQLRELRIELSKKAPSGVRVAYQPVLNRPDGSSVRWLQVIFAVGPGDDEEDREAALEVVADLLPTLVERNVSLAADFIDLCARRFDPVRGVQEDAPVFIRVCWDAAGLRQLAKPGQLEKWHDLARVYANFWNEADPLNKGQRAELA